MATTISEALETFGYWVKKHYDTDQERPTDSTGMKAKQVALCEYSFNVMLAAEQARRAGASQEQIYSVQCQNDGRANRVGE